MGYEVAFAHYYVEEHGAKSCTFFGLVVINENIFELIELCCHVIVVAREFVYSELAVEIVVEKPFDISEHHLVFILHVFSHLFDIIVEELYEQQSHFVCVGAVYGFYEITSYARNRYIKKKRVGTLQITYQ